MKTTLPILFSAVLTTATLAWANDPKPAQQTKQADAKADASLSAADRQFVTDAAVGGIAEVKMGELAMMNGLSQGVKDFGKRLVDDRSKVNKELMSTAKPLGATVPTETDAEHKKHLDMLSKLKGAEFDKAFATHMVEGHQKMIAKFKAEAADGKAEALKAFAKKTLPTLEDHLRIAEGLAKPKT